MLKVVIVGYGEMFTNLIAGTLDSGCEIAGVLRKDTVKYHPLWRKIKDIINPSVEYNYIKRPIQFLKLKLEELIQKNLSKHFLNLILILF